jgi:RluA family pseudouridine synthase
MVRECWEIPIVYEDAHLLALNKPPQFLTSPDRTDRERPNLMTLLQQEITRGAGWVRERGISYLCNAHRLDFDSSGLLLLAKDKNTLVEMASMFGSFKPIQTFLALVHGVLPEPRVEVDAKLSPHLQRPGLMRVDMKNGKLSQTIFQTREAFRDFSLVECQPLTVRKDQVRVHLQCAKVALVADPIYGGPSLWLSQIKKHFRLKDGRVENPLINRPALHAERLAFKHPATGEEVRIEAPVAKDMAVAIKYLRRYGVPAGPTNPEESHPETGTDVA